MRRTEIDEAILSNVNATWKKVALVVVKVANESGISFADEDDDFEVVAQHIEFLVGEGRLLARAILKIGALVKSANHWVLNDHT